MKILQLARHDNSGATWFIREALRAHTTHDVVSLRMFQNRLDYPAHRVGQRDEIHAYCKWADVIHVHDDGYKYISQEFYGKPTLWTLHGSMYRNDAFTYNIIAEERGWTMTAVSADLLCIGGLDDWQWLPLPRPQMSRIRDKPGEVVQVCHAPTNRTTKGTASLLSVHWPPHIAFDLIEGVPYSECIERKRNADILIDQNTYGYGMNGVEAMAMGMPVIGAFQDDAHCDRLAGLCDDAGVPFPFVHLDTGAIIGVIEYVVERYDECAAISSRYYNAIHSYQAVAERLCELYEEAIA